MAAPIRVGVLGGGAWGTALACVARRIGHDVVLWARDPAVVAAINGDRANSACLPGIALDPAIRATTDLAEATAVDLVLLVVPAQFLRSVIERAAPVWPAGVPAVVCAKGLERPDGRLPGEIAAELLPGRPLAMLSGPSFAGEVARGLPAAVTCAMAGPGDADRIARQLSDRRFRVYSSDDVVGVQLAGAVKNVLAIAAGIVAGKALGDNARAAVITRGLAEMARLVIARGGQTRTVMGLAGLGDLMLTATSLQSRNTSVGVGLGQGRPLAAILGERRSVAEGVATAAAVCALARHAGIDMPICEAVAAVIDGRASVDAVIDGLLARPVPREWG